MDRNRIFSDDLTSIIPNEEKMPVLEWLAEQMPGGFFVYRADETTELLFYIVPQKIREKTDS